MSPLAVWWIQDHRPDMMIVAGVVLIALFGLLCAWVGVMWLHEAWVKWREQRKEPTNG